MRNLTKSIAAVSLLIPASAYSLGIGDIKLHSALNQKLDAEIALLVSADENISDIKVRLASPDKFDEAGVPWSYFLSKIKFKAVTQADGSTVVKLSSKEALREPFLDFLLEVTWASGNLYREFTVLVDPPVSYKKATIPVIQKPQQPTSNFANKPVTIINKVAAVDSQVVSGQYGPTNRMDSLWKIANKTNDYSDVTVEQMMMSIYEANPRAFYKKNVNALMAGEILKIPSKEVILKLSKRQAVVAFKKQNNVWKGRVGKKEIPIEVDNSQLTSQLELEAPATDEIANVVKLKLGNKSSAKHIVDSEIDDSKVATSDEGLALQARMDKLEQQLVMMQKILILKDEEIAALQNKTTESIVPTQIKIKTLAEVEAEKKQAKTAPVEPIAKSVVKKPPVTVKKPIVKPVIKPKLKLKPAPVVEEETDYFMLAVGGGSAIILAILAVLWRRKRNVEEEEEDTESMFASASEISLPDASDDELSIPVADDSSSYNVGTVGESSFLSEFTPSDFDAFDTDESEVDPVSE
ncbi:MAG: FimV/HubP family polar landmark protein, partial [Methylococcales bacterium]